MPIRELLRRLKVDPAERWGHAVDFLHRAERFRDLLERERMRCDRAKSMFSLAVFRCRTTTPRRCKASTG